MSAASPLASSGRRQRFVKMVSLGIRSPFAIDAIVALRLNGRKRRKAIKSKRWIYPHLTVQAYVAHNGDSPNVFELRCREN